MNPKEFMDQVSDDIKDVEFYLQDYRFVSGVSVGPLSFGLHNNRPRIMFESKPFIEAKIEKRIENHKHLEPLFKEVVGRGIKAMSATNPLNEIIETMFNR